MIKFTKALGADVRTAAPPPPVTPARPMPSGKKTIPTAPGWAPAVPPYITYPVSNVAWGRMETPPYALAKFYEADQEAPPAAPPSSPALPMQPPPTIAPTGPLPISDWFGLFRR